MESPYSIIKGTSLLGQGKISIIDVRVCLGVFCLLFITRDYRETGRIALFHFIDCIIDCDKLTVGSPTEWGAHFCACQL